MKREITLSDIAESLRATYTEDGVAIWLGNIHRAGPLRGWRPIVLCRTAGGRERVLQAAEILAQGAYA